MKKILFVITMLILTLSTKKSEAQIVITKWDTISDAAGCRIWAEWSDSNPVNSSTLYSVNAGGTIDGQNVPLVANTTQPKLLIDGSNSRLRGWGCFMNQYIKTQWVQITRYDANPSLCYAFGAMMPVPSNYVWYGCKAMDAGIGLFPSGSVVNIAWDYYTISGSYKVDYKVNGGQITTVNPTCPTASLPANPGTTLDITVYTRCADGSTTSKSTSISIPSSTTTTGTGTTTKPGKKK